MNGLYIFNHLLFLSYVGPEKPVNITITAQGTDYLSIQWTLPEGRVDRYVVNISNEELKYSNSRDVSVFKAHFTDLNPGRIFIITVTAEAGSFSNTSNEVSFATCKFNTLCCNSCYDLSSDLVQL